MAIDQKEPTIFELEDLVAARLDDAEWWTAAQEITRLIRAVIADTREPAPAATANIEAVAKAAADRVEGAVPAAPATDVPEWFYEMCFTSRTSRDEAWKRVEAEIVRRTATLTAERDAARAEAERLRNGPETLASVIVAVRDAAREMSAKGRGDQIDIADLRPLIAPLFYSLNDKLTETAKTLNDKLTAANARVAELSRPVDGVDWRQLRSDYYMSKSPDQTTALREIFEPVFLRERNARVAADAAVAELRDVLRTRIIGSIHISGQPTAKFSLVYRMSILADADLDKLLAEFRAAKGGGV